jgi:hypothetical protein
MAASSCERMTDNAVELVAGYGEWFVRIVHDGREEVRRFEVEALARAYAEGQRIRLGLTTTGPEV